MSIKRKAIDKRMRKDIKKDRFPVMIVFDGNTRDHRPYAIIGGEVLPL